jgi:hypothetical protein
MHPASILRRWVGRDPNEEPDEERVARARQAIASWCGQTLVLLILGGVLWFAAEMSIFRPPDLADESAGAALPEASVGLGEVPAAAPASPGTRARRYHPTLEALPVGSFWVGKSGVWLKTTTGWVRQETQ